MTLQCVTVILALGAFASSAWGQVPPYVTSWGGFGSGNGQFFTPVGVAVDPDGIVYVVDSNLHRLTRFTRTGSFISQWAVSDPRGVAVGPDGCVYTTRGGAVSKYTKAGVLLAEWDAGSALTAIAVDVDGSVYVSSRHGVVRRFTSSGALLSEWSASTPGFPGLEGLDGVAVDGRGHFYTVQNYRALVRKFTTAGRMLAQWGAPGAGNGQFDLPVRLVTSPNGSIVYVVDNLNSRIQAFTNVGGYLGQWGTAGTGAGQFRGPIGIAVDGHGNVFVADTNNSRIQVFGDAATSTRQISWGHLKNLYH